MKIKVVIYEIATIFFACLLIAVGLNLFLADAKLVSGGLTGISFLIEYVTGIQASLLYFLLNIPLLVLSYLKVSLRFTIYSIIGSVSLSVFLFVTSKYKSVLPIDDVLLRVIFGGALCAIGNALLFRIKACTGGIDILAFIWKKKNPTINMGDISFVVNTVIVILYFIFLRDITKALYSLLFMYILAAIVNKLIFGFNRKYLVLIITKSPDKIKDYILNVIHRGVTSSDSEGGYTKEKQNILYTVLEINQYVSLRNKIDELDPKAFLFVMETKSVYGNGFSEI